MKFLQWIVLCIVYILYILIGASIFMALENKEEKEQNNTRRTHHINEIIVHLDEYINETSLSYEIWLAAKDELMNSFLRSDEEKERLKWTYYHSVYFAYTVANTIGYGNLAPKTDGGKLFIILFGLFGIPINGMLIYSVGDFFKHKLLGLHNAFRERKYSEGTSFIFEITFYIIPGILVFLIVPAAIFYLIEDWTFIDSVYFAFTSLTTIGLGDFVAGVGDNDAGSLFWIYTIFLIFWIMFGLGYVVMILGFISDVLEPHNIEKKLIAFLKTKDKLTEDVEYMKRVINELYLWNLGEHYDVDSLELDTRFKRSLSQPNIWHNDLSSSDEEKIPRNRTLSEADVDCIDLKERNFSRNSFIEQRRKLSLRVANIVTNLNENTALRVIKRLDELNQFEKQLIENGIQKKINNPSLIKITIEPPDSKQREEVDLEQIYHHTGASNLFPMPGTNLNRNYDTVHSLNSYAGGNTSAAVRKLSSGRKVLRPRSVTLTCAEQERPGFSQSHSVNERHRTTSENQYKRGPENRRPEYFQAIRKKSQPQVSFHPQPNHYPAPFINNMNTDSGHDRDIVFTDRNLASESTVRPRTVTPSHADTPVNSRKISTEQTLANFYQVLDHVQHKLSVENRPRQHLETRPGHENLLSHNHSGAASRHRRVGVQNLRSTNITDIPESYNNGTP